MRKRRAIFLLGALCLVAASAVEAAAQQVVQGQVIGIGGGGGGGDPGGQVIGIGGRRAGLNRPFKLIVNNYTSPDDVQQLNQALRSGGQDELLRVLGRLNAGRVAIGENVGVRANAVIATPQAEGGTKLTVLYVRDVAIFELRYGTRSADYRFGYAEIFLDARGRGQGTIIPSAKVA